MPLSVWPGLPAHETPDGRPCGGPVTAEVARRVVAAFSFPGDVVAAAGGAHAVPAAAAAAGRRVIVLAGSPALEWRRPGAPAELPPPGDPAAGTAGLAVVGRRGSGCCARPPEGADGEPALAACELTLRPGGVLAVVTAGGGPLADAAGAGSVVAAARAAGLVYAQHIVLLRAAIDGDRLAPAAPGGGTIHDDLLVFTKPGSPASPTQSGGPRL